MSSEIIAAIIAVCGVPAGILLQHFLSANERKRQNEALAKGEKNYAELQKKYHELLDGRVEHSKRKISFQLEALEDKIHNIENSGRSPYVWILGINATGPLHQGREILINLLKKEGKLCLLLLDPTHPVFQKRSEDEHDYVGRITTELHTSLYILMDILSQLKTDHKFQPSNVEIRLHHEYPPDRSLIMVNCEDEDGIVLENPYPSLKGTRGMEGEMYSLVQRGQTARGYADNVKYYKELWEKARPIILSVPDHRLCIQEWPFS